MLLLMEPHKKQAFETFKKIGLFRTHKARRRREALRGGRVFLFIGNGDAARPYLKVLRTAYLEMRQTVSEEFRGQGDAAGLTTEQCDDLFAKRVEDTVYDRLLEHARALSDLETAFEKRHGRPMTPFEMEKYTSLLKGHDAGELRTPDRAFLNRRNWLNGIIRGVRRAQAGDTDRLQAAWAAAAGTEASQDTHLERIDPARGLAICRCLSSAQKHLLQRQRDLPERLGKTLGIKISRIVFR
jgi:hypothetical protein